MGGEQNLEFGLIGVSVKSASPFLRGILALMPHIIKIQVSRTGMTGKSAGMTPNQDANFLLK
ncbi:hypothetical protein ASM33_03280 [Wolbachia endosymbiont of Folsomia candida]|nr:hypothetical protein ASM33_03280 [Wolbachia endosymbiont of Folsomia candida]